MTYGEAKQKVLDLLDEQKPKADLLAKLPGFFDTAQRETATVCPLKRRRFYAAGEERVLPKDYLALRQLWLIRGEERRAIGLSVRDDLICCEPEGELLLEYNAVPQRIDSTTPDLFELELSAEAQDAMLFFVAAQCHATEYDQRFFNAWYAQYQGRLVNLAANEPPVVTVMGGGTGWHI